MGDLKGRMEQRAHSFFSMNKCSTFLLFLIVLFFSTQTLGHKCGAMDALDASFQGDDNKRADFYDFHRKFHELHQKQHLHTRDFQQFRIPVVFHILQNELTPVITEAQVITEMGWLNDWYSARNNHYDTRGTYWEDDIAVGSEFGITFELAAYDPNGNPTNGIIYYPDSPIANDCDTQNFYDPEEGGLSFSRSNVFSSRLSQFELMHRYCRLEHVGVLQYCCLHSTRSLWILISSSSHD